MGYIAPGLLLLGRLIFWGEIFISIVRMSEWEDVKWTHGKDESFFCKRLWCFMARGRRTITYSTLVLRLLLDWYGEM